MFIPGAQPAFFIQPHSDDVALSCGGTVAASATAGAPTHVCTVFASQILEPMMTDLAREKHARWQVHDVDELFETRREEDRAAAATLDCTMRWLEWPDAIYRGDRYPSNEELFAGQIHAEEHDIAEHLARELVGLPEWDRSAAIFVPLGVGDHVDHAIAFEAGRVLAAQGHRVFAYEDTPYAIHSPHGISARLADTAGVLGGAERVFIDDFLETRIAAIAAYESQVPVIFRFTEDWRATVREHACARGHGRPAELFWPIVG